MKAAVITPIPDLERFVGPTTLHLVLAPLFNPPFDPRYQSYYAMRRSEGDYLIIDNGAYVSDGGKATSLARLLELARLIKAQEVVLSDVLHSAKETMTAAEKELAWLRTPEGQEAYDLAEYPKLMVVPQGDHFGVWKECRDWLINNVLDTMFLLGGPDPSIGVSKLYAEDIVQRVGSLDLERFETHLLGWAGGFERLRSVASMFPELRSVDSARPITYAKVGRQIHEDEPHLSRDADFFWDSVPIGYWDLTHENIRTYREVVNDLGSLE